MRANVFPGGLGRLMMVALLVVSARSECQQPADEAPGADLGQQGCPSVVLVQCAQPEAEGARADVPTDAREATRRKLQARRLRQMQAQAGLTAIEITGERPTGVESDVWDRFRQSVAGAAVPDCFSPDTFPAVQGLLRLPVLAGAAATGKCR